MIGVAAGVVIGLVLSAVIRWMASRFSFTSALGWLLLRGFEKEERRRAKEIGKERRKLLRQGVIWVV